MYICMYVWGHSSREKACALIDHQQVGISIGTHDAATCHHRAKRLPLLCCASRPGSWHHQSSRRPPPPHLEPVLRPFSSPPNPTYRSSGFHSVRFDPHTEIHIAHTSPYNPTRHSTARTTEAGVLQALHRSLWDGRGESVCPCVCARVCV